MLIYWSMTFSLISPSVFQDVESLAWVVSIWRRSCVQSRSSTAGACKEQSGRPSSWETSTSAWTTSETGESKKFQLAWRIRTAIWKQSSESFLQSVNFHYTAVVMLDAVTWFLCHSSLSHCGLTDGCCADLASGFASKESIISEVDLSGNDLRDKGVKKLCAGLKNPQCELEKLS